jgi:hypothetical protein
LEQSLKVIVVDRFREEEIEFYTIATTGVHILPLPSGNRHQEGRGRSKVLPNSLRHLMTIDVRKADIEKDHIGSESRTLLNGSPAGLCDNNVMASHLEEHRHRLRRRGVVIYDQNFL